ncbi:hypothetical protein N7491_007953 [Penicillium cf. griseofulvum]|uniref:Uncharacterized protein n=1 Tax=Penicillium cf. griseofulvum TaxID=2972120 RepID=A0A9W9J975_9EURO|nr:hypothetical protein N7472_009020 [Penicillium cf. griseofulvum]KAJ5427511.1 hypothetical protein N7491_007953 [Penicillium cf. griseofulvum]KAJ5431712.1 hypothetical protein N7445_008210 [Penicillium cf. griseofulvum]
MQDVAVKPVDSPVNLFELCLSALFSLRNLGFVRQRIRERWEKQWERETTSAPTKCLVQAPNKKTLRLYEGLSKP